MAKEIISGEMKDVDVKFVSLVKKGANKQKIEIYKEDEQMEERESESFFKCMKEWFENRVNKADETEESNNLYSFNERIKTVDVLDNLWKINDALTSTLREIALDKDLKNKKELYEKAIDEHSAYLKKKFGSGTIEKEDSFFKEESEEEMKPEDIRAILQEELKQIKEDIEALKGNEDTEDVIEKSDEDTLTAEAIADIVRSATKELREDIEAIKKARGISKSDEEDTIEKSEKEDLFAGLFC